MVRRLLTPALLLLAVSCSHPQIAGNSPSRKVASEQPVTSVIKYYTNDANKPDAPEITADMWAQYKPNGRKMWLESFWGASTRGVSVRGLKHVVCFEGTGEAIAAGFFDKNNKAVGIGDVTEGVPDVKVSKDGSMIGLAYTVNYRKADGTYNHYPKTLRISNCNAGKIPVADPTVAHVAQSGLIPPPRYDFSMVKHHGRSPASTPDNPYQEGFTIDDDAKIPSTLPRFALKADYNKATVGAADRPWKGMDITTPDGAVRFALTLQKYFYEGMIGSSATNRNFDFVADQNKSRYWCHMPWLQTGESGREAVHGLTKERDLAGSPAMSAFKSPKPGTDWGVAYYNALGCQQIGKVFGSADAPSRSPKFTGIDFPDGTFTAKILFTTSATYSGAYTWKANVSDVGETERSIRDVYHIQMDIAIRDSSVKGVSHDNNDWIMATYYFDPDYDYATEYRKILGGANPLESLKLPAGLTKMRPMGVQSGFDTPAKGESVIFTNSETNGFQGRLNGPADNPKSSCFSCHGTAGTRVPMSPGIMTGDAYLKIKATGLDFSQQMSLAKKNIETYFTNLK